MVKVGKIQAIYFNSYDIATLREHCQSVIRQINRGEIKDKFVNKTYNNSRRYYFNHLIAKLDMLEQAIIESEEEIQEQSNKEVQE